MTGRFIPRWVAALVGVVLVSASLQADVTVKSTMTMEGGPAAAIAPGPMTMVTRIKGTQSRMEVEGLGRTSVILTDLKTRTVVMLNPADKTAQVYDTAAAAASGATPLPSPKIDASVKATGQTRTIAQILCEEYAVAMTISLAEVAGGAQMPPEAAEMLKGVNMAVSGSVWVAKSGPGAAEYMSFTKAAMEANLGGTLAGAVPGQGQPGGLNKLMAVASQASGLPYLTEMTMTLEGTGPLVEIMKQQGGGMTTSIKVTDVSTEALPDDLFKVPADYKTVKQ